jgi:hypothetical protein
VEPGAHAQAAQEAVPGQENQEPENCTDLILIRLGLGCYLQENHGRVINNIPEDVLINW